MNLKDFPDTSTPLNAKNLFNFVHPVGSLYLTTVSTNPNEIYGQGTWILWGSGRVPVCVDTSDDNFNTVEKTGGSKYLEKHRHAYGFVTDNSSGNFVKGIPTTSLSERSGTVDAGQVGAIDETGSGDSGNLQPYITCYIYKRVS